MKKTAASGTAADKLKSDFLAFLPKAISRRLYQIRHREMLMEKKVFKDINIKIHVPSTFQEFYRDSDHESFIVEYIMNNLKQGSVFFDVGASVGYSSAAVNEAFSNVEIHSFEPYWANQIFIERNIHSLSKDGNKWILEKRFLSNRNSKSEVSLDEYCRINKIKPGLIKIDVDGNEYFVIEGAQQVIKERKATFIVEVHPFHIKDYGFSLSRFFDFFKGYKVFLNMKMFLER